MGRSARFYCLRCFEPLEEFDGTATCPTCGFANLRSLRRRYWNQHPYLISLENTLKAYVVFGCLASAIAFTAYISKTRNIGIYSGWLIAFPVVAVGVGLWQTISRLTQKRSYFSPVLFWVVVFVLLGLFCMTIDFRLSLVCLALIALTWIAGRALEKWKTVKISSRPGA
jgi:hypothetical protein